MKNESAGLKSAETKNPVVLLTGSTADKYPVLMDDRKTIVFISDKSREDEIRLKYQMLAQQRTGK